MCHYVWIISRITFYGIIVLKLRAEGQKYEIGGKCLLLVCTFSSQLKNDSIMKCSSDNCSYIVTYMLCMKNLWNIISMYAPQLRGEGPKEDKHFIYIPKMSECDVYIMHENNFRFFIAYLGSFGWKKVKHTAK